MNTIPTAEEMEESGEYNDYSSMMGAFARLHAIGFMSWRNDIHRFDKNIIRQNPNITVEELYKEYLKTLI